MNPKHFLKSLIHCLPLLGSPLAKRKREANVLLLHFGRCGSTAVGNLLRQHPKITWDSEILQHRKQNLLPECAITKNPKRLIRLRSLRASRSVFGFELKPLPFMHLSSAQLNMSLPHFFSYLRELKITHLIFLARKHYLRQLISLTIAIEQNKYEISPGEKLSSDQININCDSTQMGGKPIRELFHCYDFISEQIREFGHSQNRMRFLELEYQRDILGSPIKAFHKICDSLQLASPQVVLKNAKVNTASIADTVRNLHEVRDALKNTQYEWMIEQDEKVFVDEDGLLLSRAARRAA